MPELGAAQKRLQHLDWTVLRRLDGLLQGDYRTLLRGVGMDLADLRAYQHHDDVRHIDWNVTARLNEPHVRVFTEDRDMSAWFLIDRSASMAFGSGGRSKRDVANDFVATLSSLLTGRGNRVGALLHGGAESAAHSFVPARSSRQHVLQFLHRLNAQPTGKFQAKPTRLHELFEHSARVIKKRSTVFVLSDFVSAPGWEKPLGQLAERHEVIAVPLSDPLERSLPDFGLIAMRDAESGEQMVVDTQSPGFRQRFETAAKAQRAALGQALAKAGVDALELSTDSDLLSALRRFTVLRKRRSQRQAAPQSTQGKP